MPKTITLRLDDKTYSLIRKAADGERRSISNFIEYATIAYLAEDTLVSKGEMQEILNDAGLMAELNQGKSDIAKEDYTVIE